MRHFRPRGFTLFELAVSVAIIGILAAALLQRVVFYQGQAELAAMDQMVGSLRTALHLKAANLYVQHREGELVKLLDENPVDWLAEKPKNYAGEYFSPAKQQVQAGSWYFDRTDKTLVYLLNNTESFREGRPNVLKFKVKLLRAPFDEEGRAKTPGTIEGVVLEQVGDPSEG